MASKWIPPSPANFAKLSARLTHEKAPKWIDTLKLRLRQGHVGHNDMESIIGKLGFPQTFLFGMFARCQMRALYLKLRRKWYNPTLSAYEISGVRRRISILRDVSPRVVSSPSARSDWVVYTGAASETEIIADVVYHGSASGFRTVWEDFAPAVPEVWPRQFRQTDSIFRPRSSRARSPPLGEAESFNRETHHHLRW